MIRWKRGKKKKSERVRSESRQDLGEGHEFWIIFFFLILFFVKERADQLSRRKHEMLTERMLYGLLAIVHNTNLKNGLRLSNT